MMMYGRSILGLKRKNGTSSGKEINMMTNDITDENTQERLRKFANQWVSGKENNREKLVNGIHQKIMNLGEADLGKCFTNIKNDLGNAENKLIDHQKNRPRVLRRSEWSKDKDMHEKDILCYLFCTYYIGHKYEDKIRKDKLHIELALDAMSEDKKYEKGYLGNKPKCYDKHQSCKKCAPYRKKEEDISEDIKEVDISVELRFLKAISAVYSKSIGYDIEIAGEDRNTEINLRQWNRRPNAKGI